MNRGSVPGEVLVSNSGSGLQFAPRGQASLGQLGTWPLFAVTDDQQA